MLIGFLTHSQPLSLHRLFSLQVRIPSDPVGKERERDRQTKKHEIVHFYFLTIGR